jgi:hypothetical protein
MVQKNGAVVPDEFWKYCFSQSLPKKMSDKTVVWVANRDTPLSNSSGTFKIGDHGNVVVVDQVGNISWSSNETKAVQPVVQLLLEKINESRKTKCS